MAVKATQNYHIEDVQYHRSNNSIIALVVYKSGAIGLGVSRCEKTDAFNERLGKKRAVATAHPLPAMTDRMLRAMLESDL